MEMRMRKLRGIFVIDVIGEMDMYNTAKLTDLFNTLLQKTAPNLIINLDGVHSLDSSGVGTLINMYSQAKERGIKFCIANVHTIARKVLELTRLTDYFPMKETLDDAISFIENSP